MPVPLKIVSLTSEEKAQLQRLEKFDPNWRVRERVKTLLLLSEGQTCMQVAVQVGIHFRTVSYTRQSWFEEKFASLTDKPRSGAPAKMSAEERSRILAWAEEAPFSGPELLVKHLEAGGIPVHAQTIKSLLRKEDFVFKRTRASLKKKEMNPLFVLPKPR